MQFFNYDPDDVTLTLSGIGAITGFWDGTFVEVERAEDGFTHHVGATGDVTRVMNRNRTGVIRFTVSSASPINDLLTATALTDESSGGGVFSVMLTDRNANEPAGPLAESANAWFSKIPKIDKAKEASPVQWTVHCAYLKLRPSGAVS